MAQKKRSSKKTSSKSMDRTKTSTKSRSRMDDDDDDDDLEAEQTEGFGTEIGLWGIIAVALILFISNFGVGGKVGNAVSGFFFGLIGLCAYIFPILLVVGSFFAVSNKGNHFAILKICEVVLFVVALCMFMALIVSGHDALKTFNVKDVYSYCSKNHLGGGIIGGWLAHIADDAFGMIGAYIIDIIVMIISLVLITGRSALKGMKKRGTKVYESAKESRERHREERSKRRMDKKVVGVSADTKIFDPDKNGDDLSEIHSEDYTDGPEVRRKKRTRLHSDEEDADMADFPPKPENASEPIISGAYAPDGTREEAGTRSRTAESARTNTRERQDAYASGGTRRKTAAYEEVEQEAAAVEDEIIEDTPIKNYVFPPSVLLKLADRKPKGNTESQLRETAKKLEMTLKTFGVNATVTNISCGPAVTRYELQPEMGVKVSKIVNLADDLKLNLAASDIRIEAPIPGKAAVGIEVPNAENVTVSFRELIESDEFRMAKSKLAFAVGKDISGKINVTDIYQMPHLLIAGATGSGKSVCINTIIMSILYKARPDEVKLIMIDPKMVELSVYNGIPHLLIPVVTDAKKAAGALNWAVAEMMERYQKFADANVREINGYNARIDSLTELAEQDKPKKMPQIVVIVDELADLMMVASNEVEDAIRRLTQLARAAGIHLVIATQRPSVNVITGVIKANMPSRIAFAVSSGVDSRTILDMLGAERLLGKGDMLFAPQGIPKPVRMQGAFISDQEVAAVVKFLTEHNGTAQYNRDVQEKMSRMEVSNAANGGSTPISDGTEEDGRDSYFIEAAKILIDKDKASIGMLQRYLKVGFNRAARIMDQLEEAGIVGPEEGTKPRRVLMSPEEFQQYIDENG